MTTPIITASPCHAAALAALHMTIFPHAAWNESSFLTLLKQPGHISLIHTSGGLLLMRVVMDEAEILTFGVCEKRKAIGSALLREGLARLKQSGVNILYLEVAARNRPAREFYQKFGFVVTGQRKAYYEDGDDALTMSLSCRQSGDTENHG